MDDRRAEASGTNEALRAIVEGVEAETGEAFFRSLVRLVTEALGVRYAFLSEFVDEGTAFRTRAVWGRGELLENFTLRISGTPCESVLGGRMSHVPDRLRERFPADPGLALWHAESYAGVPLVDPGSGEIAGHLAIMHDRPMPDGERALAILRIFAARARAEIERQHAEEALRESESRFRDLFDEAPVGYVTVGRDARILRVNRRVAEMFGSTPQEMVGRSILDFDAESPFGRDKTRRLFTEFLEGRDSFSAEDIESVRADGTHGWMRLWAKTLRDGDGRPRMVRVAVIDVTEERLARDALAASEERLTRVLESAMDAIVTIDDGGRITLFNRAAEAVFGCPSGDALGQPVDRFLTEGLRRVLEGFRAGERTTAWLLASEGLRGRRGDGTEFEVEASVSEASADGRRLFTLILRDVEARRRAEEELGRLHRQKEYLEEEIRAVYNFDEIVGESGAMRETLKQVSLVAPTDSSVLILGETGSGKELVARAVHSNSRRRDRPLVKVNCAALPPGLIESELFGHEKGAFTGATARRIGRFELADGGTLFLDEIGEMPPDVQAKCLRVLQEQELERVGGSRTIRVDVRVIAATNRDLERAVAAGTFRQDLYYRLNVFPIRLPPLRERPEDVPALVSYFVTRNAARIGRRVTSVPEPVMQRLLAYDWPGNVRELENVIERAVILSPGSELDVPPGLLPATRTPVTAAPSPGTTGVSLTDVERQHILEILERTSWRIEGAGGAASALGLRPSTLRSRMQKLGIRRKRAAAV